MAREFTVTTPENVEIIYTLAGIGSRFAAVLLDHLLQGLLLVSVVLAALAFIGGLSNWMGGVDDLFNLSGWAMGALAFAYFLIIWGYFIVFEAVWNGQTPGKRWLNLRVVKENGQPVDFFTSAIRNLVRILDALPTAYGIGVTCMFFSPAYKRVGDYAAGTVVVKEYRDPSSSPSPPASLRQEPAFPFPVPETAGFAEDEAAGTPLFEETPGVTIPFIGDVTREEYEAAHRFMDRRGELAAPVAAEIARRLATPILARLDMTPSDADSYPYGQFLEELCRDFMRRRAARF